MSSAAVMGAASSHGLRKVELSIRGMTCAACAARVEKKLVALGDVAATVNLATERAAVVAPPSVPVERLIEAVEQAGYEAELTGPAAASCDDGADAGSGDAFRVGYLRRRLATIRRNLAWAFGDISEEEVTSCPG